MKRIFLMLLLFLLPASVIFGAEPQVAAQGAALIDGKTGRLLWGKEETKPLAMASTAKIMTAILVLEHCGMDEVVSISKNAARQPEVHMDLKEGEQWKVGDLLSAMMLRSYNDAAVALAEHTFGSTEVFCQKMTEKARKLGAKDTVFGSPNGLDSHLTEEVHHSAAYDMARIAEIIAQPKIDITDLKGKRRTEVTNADRFLREYRGAIGVKTGYTNRAGHCFVGAAERDGVRLVSAVLGSGWGAVGKEKKWTDTKALMEYGFAMFQPYEAVRKGTVFGEVAVADSPVKRVETVLGEGYCALFSEAERESLRLEAVLPEQVEAPVAAGDKMGKAILYLGAEPLAEIDLLAGRSARGYTLSERMEWLAGGWISWRKF
ncbi:MAG: D-alanyl-D-alanine carboxypeptidase family protein [Bacillota bacterium]|nr:D-alanyl-D-alanine carboxypeptidase family protein [Bacillota bacterium]